MEEWFCHNYLEYDIWNIEEIDVISVLKSNINRELEVLKKQGTIKSGLEVDLGIQFSKLKFFMVK